MRALGDELGHLRGAAVEIGFSEDLWRAFPVDEDGGFVAAAGHFIFDADGADLLRGELFVHFAAGESVIIAAGVDERDFLAEGFELALEVHAHEGVGQEDDAVDAELTGCGADDLYGVGRCAAVVGFSFDLGVAVDVGDDGQAGIAAAVGTYVVAEEVVGQ